VQNNFVNQDQCANHYSRLPPTISLTQSNQVFLHYPICLVSSFIIIIHHLN